MAKKAYIGISNKARRSKKIYIGINGKARKVKKGYIGVGGKARQFYQYMQELVKYTGVTLALSRESGINQQYRTSFNNCAIFYPKDGTNAGQSVDVFNSSLTKSTKSITRSSTRGGSIGAVGNYMVMCGYYSLRSSTYTGDLNAYGYNTSWTQTTAPDMTYYHNPPGVTIGNYLIFMGGYTTNNSSEAGTTYVDVYSSSLTKATPSKSLSSNCHGWYTANNTYAIALGLSGQYSSQLRMHRYNNSLTYSYSASVYNYADYYEAGACATVGNYVIMTGGGVYASGSDTYISQSIAYAINDSFTVTSITSLTTAREVHAGFSSSLYATFAGGVAYTGNSSTNIASVESYDNSLTKSINPSLSAARYSLEAASAGNYILFAGGSTSFNNNLTTIDIYKLD